MILDRLIVFCLVKILFSHVFIHEMCILKNVSIYSIPSFSATIILIASNFIAVKFVIEMRMREIYPVFFGCVAS